MKKNYQQFQQSAMCIAAVCGNGDDLLRGNEPCR